MPAHSTIDPRLPKLYPFDDDHISMGSNTFATDLRMDSLKRSKYGKGLNAEDNLLEMVQRLCGYRREIQFFRTVYGGSEALVLGVRSVVQQMILNYYLRPEVDGDRDEQWLELSTELEGYMTRYAASVSSAEAEWLELSSRQAEIDRSSKRF